MRNAFLIITITFMAITSCSINSSPEGQEEGLVYPVSEKLDTAFSYFGTEVGDPYQWLEDENSEQTKAWVKAQNEVSFGYLHALEARQGFRKRLEQLWDYPKRSAPFKVGEYYLSYHNDGLQNQAVIYKQKGLDGESSVFLDPNAVNPDGTTSLSIAGQSKDGRYVAVDRSEAGSDWSTLTVMEIESGETLTDQIEWVKFSGATWYKNGFFYSRYPAPVEGDELSATNTGHMVYYHRIGTEQSEDELVYQNTEEPNLYHWVDITEDELFLVLYVASGTDGFECHFKSLEADGAFRPLFTGFKNKSTVIDHVDGRFLVLTDIDAPNSRLVSIDPDDIQQSSWREIVPESEHLLQTANTGGAKLFLKYLENACNALYACELDGSGRTSIELPGSGSTSGLGGKADQQDLFYSYTSFNYPTTIFKYNVASGQSELFYQPDLSFDPEEFVSKQLTYPSKDGTEVNMFVVHKRGMEMNGNNPTLLYGYGGFNINITPSFSVSNIALLEQGGVYAVANLRGGGEFGEEWHKAGMLLKKQNVFDDFISAADYLIAEGYTSTDKLAIEGRSNGGLLVGACMAQRPDLYAVAFPGVGVMDMLRYHRFTVGWGWIPEYGCADSSQVEFENLKSYSPYHNLKMGTDYPATMVTTADHDDRVVPAHSYKFAARLQECHQGVSPVLIRIDVDAGHGAGKPTSMVLDELADKWAFMFANMGLTFTSID